MTTSMACKNQPMTQSYIHPGSLHERTHHGAWGHAVVPRYAGSDHSYAVERFYRNVVGFSGEQLPRQGRLGKDSGWEAVGPTSNNQQWLTIGDVATNRVIYVQPMVNKL